MRKLVFGLAGLLCCVSLSIAQTPSPTQESKDSYGQPTAGLGLGLHTSLAFLGSSDITVFDEISGQSSILRIDNSDLFERFSGWQASLLTRLPRSDMWVFFDIGRSTWTAPDQISTPEGDLAIQGDNSVSLWNYQAAFLFLPLPESQKIPLPHGGPFVGLTTESFSGGESSFHGGLRVGLHYPILHRGAKRYPVLMLVDCLSDLFSKEHYPKSISMRASLLLTW